MITQDASRSALAIIKALKGRRGFDEWWREIYSDDQGEILAEIAEAIDREILLPHRNVALLLAQSLVDADNYPPGELEKAVETMRDIIPQLRDALAAIKR